MPKTYTAAELATLFGLSKKDINNAKQQRNATFMPGTKNHAVREAMKTHGITWDMLVPGQPGPQSHADAEHTLDLTPVHAKPEPGMGINQNFEKAIAEMEAEARPALDTPVPDPEPEKANQLDSSELAYKTTKDVEEDGQRMMFGSSHRPNYIRDWPLMAHIPLEALVAEITRRMPRAEVVLR